MAHLLSDVLDELLKHTDCSIGGYFQCRLHQYFVALSLLLTQVLHAHNLCSELQHVH